MNPESKNLFTINDFPWSKRSHVKKELVLKQVDTHGLTPLVFCQLLIEKSELVTSYAIYVISVN